MSRVADLIDAALEFSVVGSFTRVGALARRRLDDWQPIAQRLDGRVVVITGATSGLGRQTAMALAQLGATVEILARNETRAAATCTELRELTGNSRIDYVVVDTGDLAAVRQAALTLRARHPSIDVLIHNAGALDDTYQLSADGIEQTVASQVVGPHLLTHLLRPALAAAAPSRVVWVSSGGMYSEALDVTHLEMSAADYDGTVAYARAKRAQVTLTELWAERLRSDGIVVHAMHPGWADTPGVARSLPRFRRAVGRLLRSVAEGADTIIWLAADGGEPLANTGRFWHDRRPRKLHRLARTRRADTGDERAALWEWVTERSGLGDARLGKQLDNGETDNSD